MSLATFAVVSRRWRPTILFQADYSEYRQLSEYLPSEIFEARMKTLHDMVRKKCPQIWPDYYLFIVAIALIVFAAGFSIVARSQGLSIWYPLLILIIPAIIAYWNTRRKNMHILRMNKFRDEMQTCLKEMTMLDIVRQVKWTQRRVRTDDTEESMHVTLPLNRYAVLLVVEAHQIDPEQEARDNSSLALPNYCAAGRDVVIDVGPPMSHTPIHDGDQPAVPPPAMLGPTRAPPAYEQDPAERGGDTGAGHWAACPPPAYEDSHAQTN